MATPTQADLDAIDARIATIAGVRSTSFADQSTQFSLEDLYAERARLVAALAVAAGTSSTRYAAFSKGL